MKHTLVVSSLQFQGYVQHYSLNMVSLARKIAGCPLKVHSQSDRRCKDELLMVYSLNVKFKGRFITDMKSLVQAEERAVDPPNY